MLESRGYLDIGGLQDRYADPGSDDYNILPGARHDMKISMYLEINAAVYIRTLTQGARLTEGRKLSGVYKRSATQTARGTAGAKGFAGFYRSVVQAVTNAMTVKGPLALARKLTQQVGAEDVFGRLLSMLRIPAQTAGAGDGTERVTQAKRFLADTGKAETGISRKQDFRRDIAHGGNVKAAALRSAGYVKRLQETAGSADSIGVVRELALRLIEAAAGLYDLKAAAGFDRRIADKAGIGSVAGGMVRFFRVVFGVGGSGDNTGRFVGRMRVIQDTETAGDAAGHTADYVRGLFIEAGVIAEKTHAGWHKRSVADYADAAAVPVRHLFIVIRLLTGAFIRDFIIGRFLKSNEEIVLKSPVCREITLESTLH
jgi:hypothetical protein